MLGKAYRSFHHRTIALLFLVHGFFGLDKGDRTHGAIERVSTIALLKITTSKNKIKLLCWCPTSTSSSTKTNRTFRLRSLQRFVFFSSAARKRQMFKIKKGKCRHGRHAARRDMKNAFATVNFEGKSCIHLIGHRGKEKKTNSGRRQVINHAKTGIRNTGAIPCVSFRR